MSDNTYAQYVRETFKNAFLDVVDIISSKSDRHGAALKAVNVDDLLNAFVEYEQALYAFDDARATPLASESPYKQLSMEMVNAIDRRLRAQRKLLKFVKDAMRKVRK